MKSKAVLSLMLLGVMFTPRLRAQTTQAQPRDLDIFYHEQRVTENVAIPYDYVNESDVYWHKRVWREIDVHEKMNLPFRYEGIDWKNLSPLITTLRNAAISGELTMYDDESFQRPLSADEIRRRGAGFDTIPVQDLEGNVIGDTVLEHPFDPNKVVSYRVKEDWFFNKKTSQMQVRIMGLAPLYHDDEANIDYPLFWVHYPSARNLLARSEVFNPKNDAHRWTWDDIFEMRLFSSTIIKESNLFDRKIQEYATGVDALRESDRIKNDIFDYEHDLWSF